MKRVPRLVLDTNVVISAMLWGGKPGQLFTLAGEGLVRLYTSRMLLDELIATLRRPKLHSRVEATGHTADRLSADYRLLCTLARPPVLKQRYSRDLDDDHVIACAIAARADLLVTGDDDLLVLRRIESIRIVNPDAALNEIA